MFTDCAAQPSTIAGEHSMMWNDVVRPAAVAGAPSGDSPHTGRLLQGGGESCSQHQPVAVVHALLKLLVLMY